MAHDYGDDLGEAFADPPKDRYGNVPFWWWDGDELSEERITDQLETLSERGVEAVCFEQKYPHGPPEGPQVEYFSEEWWEYMEHTVAECDRLGVALWIHDLTYHHSPPKWKRYWQNRAEEAMDDVPDLQGYVLDRVAADVAPGETASLDVPDELTPISVAAYPRDADGALSLDDGVDLEVSDGTVSWTAPEADADPAASVDADAWHVTAVGYRPEGLNRTSPDLIEWIIEQHYEEYEERVGDAFGGALVGTFQDELYQLQGTIPCDDALLDRYRADWGEDLTERAVALYEDCGEGTAAVRARFWDVVVTALEENWFRPLFEWHDRRGLRLAHDNWGRNDLNEHVIEYGDYVRTMRWYHEPGYDDGGEFEGVGTRNFFDAKLAASIAANYDRDRVWGELFHTTGWGFPPDLHYAGIAENACYGLDHYNKHGLYYATLGGWYEHAPPDTHFRQPYWEQADAFNDAVSRLMYASSRGDRVVDAAMLYPITSVQSLRPAGADPDPEVPGGNYRPDFPDLIAEIDERTREIAEAVYDDVTDLLIVDHETVRDGSVTDGQFSFAGGAADVFVLGPLATVRRAVAETLLEFVADGGTVVSLGRLPAETVEGGADDPVLADLYDAFDVDADEATDAAPADPVVAEYGDGATVRAASVDAVESVLEERVDLDVRAPADVYHAHRRVGDRDVYLFLNTRDEARTLDVTVRATGRPERLDVAEGAVEPLHEYDRDGATTTLELDVAPHEFHLVGFDDGADAASDADAALPSVVDTTLTEVADVSADDGGVSVTGFVDDGGEQSATVAVGDDTYRAAGEARSVPDAVALDEGWSFELDPTMDNEWGDFRYPPSDEVLGPEVRAFDHRTEGPDEDGVAAGWHESGPASTVATRDARDVGSHPSAGTPGMVMDGVAGEGGDGDGGPETSAGTDGWTATRWSYGHRFWRAADADGDVPTPDESPDPGSEDVPDDWEPYEFSTEIGKPGTHPDDHGHNGVVGDDFLVAPEGDGPTQFWTTVAVDSATRVACHVGEGVRRLSAGDETVIDDAGDTADGNRSDNTDGVADPIELELSPGTTAVHAVVEPGTVTHVALEPAPAEAHEQNMDHVPRVRWFHETNALDFDPTPWAEERTDWFRFGLPVGATAFEVPIEGDRRVWVDGEEQAVDANGRVTLAEPRDEPRTAVVRAAGDSVPAGAARWTGPAAVETEAATVDVGDWRDLGLTGYSGVGVYSTTVSVPDVDGDDRIVLDLGDLNASARVAVDGEVVGTAFSEPYEIDLSSAVTPGVDHRITVEVANTIANHLAEEVPTRYVYEGQTASGLFGPVRLRVRPSVTLAAED